MKLRDFLVISVISMISVIKSEMSAMDMKRKRTEREEDCGVLNLRIWRTEISWLIVLGIMKALGK